MRRVTLVLVGALAMSVAVPGPGYGAASTPTVTGPVAGKPVIFAHTTFDLGSVGYTQAEYFLAGTATAYQPSAPLTAEGRWTVAPASSEPYVTRIVVNRPTKAKDFNGTVIVEWLNVSGGVDASPDWVHTQVELTRRGYAWVGVSAQAVGMNQLKCAEMSSTCAAAGDPARYASLSHPGDSYSYDIYSQAGQAVRAQARQVLGGLRPERVLAIGESQSAGRLVTYINAVHPVVRVYDGFLVHSRGAGGAPLRQAPLPAEAVPSPTRIRDDLDVPVLVFQAENDSLAARQDDTRRFRLWEVAGTAHFDIYGLIQGATDRGDLAGAERWFASMRSPTNQPSERFTCATPINAGPQTYVLRAAVAALHEWVAEGTLPPPAPRYEVVSVQPAEFVVDDVGNVRGGIRTPAVDAPVAVLRGSGQTGAQFCNLFGTTTPLTTEQLTARYGDQQGFVKAWNQATKDAVKRGFVVAEDAKLLRAAAKRSSILG